MKINHHLDDSTLMSCAAGSQPEALAAVVSSHLSVCPRCRTELKKHALIGEALFLGPMRTDYVISLQTKRRCHFLVDVLVEV